MLRSLKSEFFVNQIITLVVTCSIIGILVSYIINYNVKNDFITLNQYKLIEFNTEFQKYIINKNQDFTKKLSTHEIEKEISNFSKVFFKQYAVTKRNSNITSRNTLKFFSNIFLDNISVKEIIISDFHGNIIFSTTNQNLPNDFSKWFIEISQKNESLLKKNGNNNILISALNLKDISSKTYFLLTDTSQISQKMKIINLLILTTMFSVIVIFALLMLLNSQKAFSNINAIAYSLHEVSMGNLSARTIIKEKNELALISKYSNDLAADLQRALIDLEKSINYFETTFESINEAIRVLDEYGNIIAVNEAMIELINLPKNEIIGRKVNEIFGDNETMPKHIDLYKTNEVTKYNYKKKLTNGKIINCLVKSKIYTSSSGEILGQIDCFEEIGKQEKIKNELKKALSKNEAIIDKLPVAIIIIDNNLNIIRVNTFAVKLFEAKEKNEIIGRNIREFTSSSKSNKQRNVRILKTIKNNTIYIIRNIIHTIEHGKKIRIITMVDVSDSKKIESALINAKAAADEANLAKSNFLANMSHELRTPLNGVIGMAELLQDTDMTNEQKEYTETISKSAYDLLNILNDILDFYKMQAGKLKVSLKEFNFREIIEDIAKLYSPAAEKKGLKIYVNYDINLPNNVKGDPDRIRQIIANIVSNAIKFTDCGYVYIKVTGKKIEDDQNSISYNVFVKDTGIGIPDDFKEKVFQKFTQVDSSASRKFGGTGLGLSISQDLIEMFGGKISLAKKQQRGSKFIINIPFETNSSPKNITLENNLKNKKIINISTDQIISKLIHTWLQAANISFYNFKDFNAANKIFKELNNLDEYIFLVDSNNQLEENISKILKQDKNAKIIALLPGTTTIPCNVQIVRKPLTISRLFSELNNCCNENYTKLRNKENTPGHALIVDDSIITRTVLNKMLQSLNWQISTAINSREALEILENNASNFNLVITDVQMHGIDGIDLSNSIKKLYPHLKIIGISGDSLENLRDEHQFDNFIRKPVKINDLKKVIKII